MSTRHEKERQRAAQEKYQAVLSQLLKDEDNKYCVDCDAKGSVYDINIRGICSVYTFIYIAISLSCQSVARVCV